MHFDALTLACAVHEMREQVVPGRIQNVVMPEAHAIAFEIYAGGQRHHVRARVRGQTVQMNLISAKARRGDDPVIPLLEQLRKYARGSTLTRLEQPDPTERVVVADLAHGQHGASRLVLELTGRQGNALLLDAADTIRGLLRVDTGSRGLRPRATYMPPPQRDRLSPLQCTAQELQSALACSTRPKAWQALTQILAGVGPTQARELVFRVTGTADAVTSALTGQDLWPVLRDLWAPIHDQKWTPSLVEEEGQVVLYAPYRIRCRDGAQAVPSLNEVLDRTISPDPYSAARTAVQTQLARARRQVQRRLAAVQRDLPEPHAADRLRTQGQWLLALQHSLQPGQTELEIPDGETEAVRLQPDRTPVQQAEAMFKRARKLERAAVILPRRIQDLQQDQAYLEQLELDLATARNRPDIAAVREDLETAGLLRHQGTPRSRTPVPSPATRPRTYTSVEGFPILVGRNARQNDHITFRRSAPRDLWLHVRDAAGAHVLIRSAGRTVSPATLQGAAQLAAFHSGRRGENRVPVMVTEKRHVTRLRRGRPGQVRVRKGSAQVVMADAVAPGWEEVTD